MNDDGYVIYTKPASFPNTENNKNITLTANMQVIIPGRKQVEAFLGKKNASVIRFKQPTFSLLSYSFGFQETDPFTEEPPTKKAKHEEKDNPAMDEDEVDAMDDEDE